jgi:phosphoribosylformylglycinamidine synthase
VLDALTSCGGPVPPEGSTENLVRIRDLVTENPEIYATDISQGGLLAALATLGIGAGIALEGDVLVQLFSETYGRFLIASDDESAFHGLPCRIIGTCGGDGLDITCGTETFVIASDEISHALSSLSRTMFSG